MQCPPFGPFDRLRAGSAALRFAPRRMFVSSKSRRARERALRYSPPIPGVGESRI